MNDNAENVNGAVTEKELAEWQALCDAATPGPWYMDSGEALKLRAPHGGYVAILGNLIGQHGSGGREQPDTVSANAGFIDHARTGMPRLIAEVRRLNDKLSLYVIENDELEGEKQEAEGWVQDIFTALKKNFPPCDVEPTEEGIYAKQVVDYIRDLVSENERLKGGTA